MIVSLRTQRRALAVPRRAGQICGLLRWMRICKTIGASAGASPRPTLGAALYDRCCAKRSFPILLRQPGWHLTIGIRDSRGCGLHNTKSVGGHIRPNRKFARTSFSKSFFMVFTCLIRTGLVQKITGELVISSPEKQHGRVLRSRKSPVTPRRKWRTHRYGTHDKTCTCDSGTCTFRTSCSWKRKPS